MNKLARKIIKHGLIIKRRFNQANTLRRARAYNSLALKQILNAYDKVWHKNFSDQDQKAFGRCEQYRQRLLKDNSLIDYSVFGLNKSAKISKITKKAASSKAWCQFLYFLTKVKQSPYFLEIGTNVGISGSYVLEALNTKKEGHFTSMEGLPQLCSLTKTQFGNICPNEKYLIIEGLYENTFSSLVESQKKFNLLFIDGNHQKEPTLHYFNELKKNLLYPAIFIFDDINWSKDMQDTWSSIKLDESVNYSIDLYEQGLVVIDPFDANRNIAFELHLSY